MSRNKMLFVFLVMFGGALGSLARYELGSFVGSQEWAKTFPFGTLIINVVGSFVLGVVVVVVDRLGPDYKAWMLLCGTGFCGGFTTFSAFELETYELLLHRRVGPALVYVVGSVTL